MQNKKPSWAYLIDRRTDAGAFKDVCAEVFTVFSFESNRSFRTRCGNSEPGWDFRGLVRSSSLASTARLAIATLPAFYRVLLRLRFSVPRFRGKYE
jgi:hypothetical protein